MVVAQFQYASVQDGFRQWEPLTLASVYISTPEQGGIARNMTQAKVFGRPIVTEVLSLSNYWPAEGYHQDFFERNPFQGYCMAVAAPKVEKFRKTFARLFKA